MNSVEPCAAVLRQRERLHTTAVTRRVSIEGRADRECCRSSLATIVDILRINGSTRDAGTHGASCAPDMWIQGAG